MTSPDIRPGAGRLIAEAALAGALLTWWLVGPLEEPGGDDVIWRFRFGADHPWVAAGLGLAASGLLAADVHRRWWPWCRRRVLAPLAIALAAGAVVGGSGRLITATSVGANIGGGMAMMFGPFVAIGLLAHALHRARRAGPPR